MTILEIAMNYTALNLWNKFVFGQKSLQFQFLLMLTKPDDEKIGKQSAKFVGKKWKNIAIVYFYFDLSSKQIVSEKNSYTSTLKHNFLFNTIPIFVDVDEARWWRIEGIKVWKNNGNFL